MKLFHYKLQIILVQPDSEIESEVLSEKVEVALENENYIVLDDAKYTKVALKELYCGAPQVEKPTVITYVANFTFGTAVLYEVFSRTPKSTEHIKADILKAISEKYGVFGTADLSYLDTITL